MSFLSVTKLEPTCLQIGYDDDDNDDDADDDDANDDDDDGFDDGDDKDEWPSVQSVWEVTSGQTRWFPLNYTPLIFINFKTLFLF